MKAFLFFLVMIPTFANAFPALGDYVRFEAKYEDSVVVIEKSVLSHDVEQNTFEVRTLMTFKDSTLQDVVHVQPYSFLYNESKVASVIKNCFAREGMITPMVVDGRHMNVCEFWDEGSQLTYMIGPVPFGQVRFQVYLQGEEFLDFHLKKYTSP